MKPSLPLLYEYKNDDNNVAVYGARMLFDPKPKLDPRKYILWTDSVHLTDISCYLYGPFNFDSRSDIFRSQTTYFTNKWKYMLTVYDTFSIVTPILSTLTDVKVSNKKRKQQS